MRPRLTLLLLVALGALTATPALAAGDPRSLLQLVDYVGVDYGAAVSEAGEVVHAAEYAEMTEFSRRIGEGIAALPEGPAKTALGAEAGELARRVTAQAPPAQVAVLTRGMRDRLMRAFPVALTPNRPPDLSLGATLYRGSCASCHGLGGRGDGPASGALEPPPTDFHDAERARQRSLFGLYNTITLGVDGTAMAEFSGLSDEERWALAFYVGSLFADADTLAAGERAWDDRGGLALRQAVVRSPDELAASEPEGAVRAAWARSRPEALFAGRPDPIAVAISRIEESAAAYAQGDVGRAQALAVSAYLDGFELSEAGLTAVAPGLVREVEKEMMGFRQATAAGGAGAEVARRSGEVVDLLRRAQDVLSEESLSAGVAFTSALLILLREGLEAILILGAIIAFVIRTGRRDALLWVHAGWAGALLAGALTWVLASWVVGVSGAAREITEGIAALLAAAMLFYVGFWMHHKLKARRWSHFLQTKLQGALDGRTLAGIAAISFLAVYREVLETVLFYQALWSQVDAAAYGALLGGALAAAAALAALGWAIFKLGVRLPLRQFFAVSAGAMFVLAVVFAGKGIVALQEAGRLPITLVPFPRIELLGVYPTAQSLLAQLVMVLAAVTLVLWSRREQPAAG